MKRFEAVIHLEDDLPQVAADLLGFAGDRRIFLLKGEMGAGKTTLIKALCRQLGSHDHFSSPTFSLINEYQSPVGKIYHLDLYRIKQPDELFDIGVDELLDGGHYCFIEWPLLVIDLLEDDHVNVELRVVDDHRVLSAEIISAGG